MARPRARGAATWARTIDGTYQLTLTSPALAREVCLTLAQGEGFFTDNYFDLLPGETKRLAFWSQKATSLARLRRQLAVRTLADSS